MNRALVYILNGALIAVCCWYAAGVLTALATAATAAPIATSAPTQRPPAPVRSWEDRQRILTRNLFEASTLAPVAARAVEDVQYEKTKLALRLLGTAASSVDSESWAAVENRTERRHEIVHIGGEIEGAKVIAIDPRRIVLDNKGRREELAMEQDESAPREVTRRTPTRPPRTAGGVRNIGRNRFAVDSGQVEALANNPAALFGQARFIPNYEDGKMNGVQLNAIKPGSLLEQAGLQDGDTVMTLNGIDATTQQGSQQLLQELQTATTWSLTVRDRNGAERTLEFEQN